jgi:hypothetical protein
MDPRVRFTIVRAGAIQRGVFGAIATVLATATAGGCAPAEGRLATLGVNDVSVLFPLPRSGPELGLLPLPSDEGPKGTLLPRAVYDRLPLLLTFGGPNAVYGALRVVGARVDPCFPGLGPSGPTPCRAQLRLVFQPLTSGFDGDPTASTDDAALHAFYALDATELDSLARGLSRLRLQSGVTVAGERSGPHPVIAREGLAGAYATGVRALIRAHAGERNLVRVTFMTLEQVDLRWVFGGVELGAGGAMEAMTIPMTGGATRQAFGTFDGTGERLQRAAASPASGSPDEVSLFYDSVIAGSASPEAQRATYARALRIEDPTRHSPDTVDCVSCHTATPARAWAERALGLRAEQFSGGYFAAGDAVASANEREIPANSLRAFGYFRRIAAVSRRTVNESVVVADALNRALGTVAR